MYTYVDMYIYISQKNYENKLQTSYPFTKYFSMYLLRTKTLHYIAMVQFLKSGHSTLKQHYYL